METMLNLTRQEKEEKLDILYGCINRICVSGDVHEIVRLIGVATQCIAQLGCNNIRRIREDK